MKMTRLEKLQKIGLNSDETAKVLIYSDQGLRWIKNTNEFIHQKEMDKFTDSVVLSQERRLKSSLRLLKTITLLLKE